MKTHFPAEPTHKNLSDFTSEGIAVFSDGKVVDSNENFSRMFGFDRGELTGMSLFHFFPKVYRELTDPKNSAKERRLETLCVRNDSSTFPAEIIVKRVKLDGEAVGVVVVRDESERKKLDNELLKSTFFQKAILDSANLAIISTDFNGLIKTFNKGAEKIFSLKAKEVVDAVNIVDLHNEDEIRHRAIDLSEEMNKKVKPGFNVFVEKLHAQNMEESEWTWKKSDGTTLIASVAVMPLKDSFDEITGYLFTGSDITDKKNAQAEIVDKSQLLNGILSNMPVFVFKVNEDGHFTQSIGAGLQNVKMKENQLVGKNIFTAFPEHEAMIEKAFGGEFVTFVHSLEADGVQAYYEYYLFPDLSRKAGLIGFALDISEKIEGERKLKDAAENLSKINQELNQFAYIVSHDLKAPLRAIANLSTWIEEDLGEETSGDVADNLALLRDRVQRMQNLIDGILDYSRAGRVKSDDEEINLLDLVKETVQMVAVPEAFAVDIAAGLPVLFGNRTWFEQIFSNLISNAVKYHHKKSGKITVGYSEEEKNHIFSVEDDGPGIAPDHQERVFLIFQTLQSKDVKDSTGIGLAIVKKIIEEQGGKIWIESDGQSGTKFIFTIPKTRKSSE